MRNAVRIVLPLLVLATLAMTAFAQSYPSKPSRYIVPFPQGGRTGSRRVGWCWGGDWARTPGGWHRLHMWFAAAMVALAATGSSALFAQPYPSKPIRYIVPFPPGGGTDVSARAMAPAMAAALGQQVVIENRAGAGGMIGTELVAKSPPDGYNLLQATVGQVAINQFLVRKPAIDPARDLAAVTLTGDIFNILVVHPALPARSVTELVALAKRRPGALNFGSSGIGVPDHLAGELFQITTRTKLEHVPYKGGPLAMVDLVSGNIQIMFATVASAIGMIKADKLRPLAITNSRRFPLMPNLPTVSEAGIPGFAVNNWTGVFVQGGTPRDVIVRLHKVIAGAAGVAETRALMLDSGIGAAVSVSPEEFARFVQTEAAKWQKVIADARISVE